MTCMLDPSHHTHKLTHTHTHTQMRESVAHVARTVVHEALIRGGSAVAAASSAATAAITAPAQQALLTGELN